MLTKRDLKSHYPGLLALNEANLAIARDAMSRLWNERLAERGMEPDSDRSGSCKFAALLCRELFGGRLAGNYEHMFVKREGRVLDLNEDQGDVQALGAFAHLDVAHVIEHRDYRLSLANCQKRVERWVDWVMQLPNIERSSPVACSPTPSL